MNNLLDGLMSELGNDGIAAIAGKLGMEPGQAQSAIAGALPMIVGALARNTGQASGADALLNALGQHAGNGSLLEQIGRSMGASADGNAILGHVFGARQQAATAGVSSVSGLDAGNAGALLSMLAPLVMSYFGRHAQQGKLTSDGLSSMLGQQLSQIRSAGSTGVGLLDTVLGSVDRDGDGLDLGDILTAGSGILGALKR